MRQWPTGVMIFVCILYGRTVLVRAAGGVLKRIEPWMAGYAYDDTVGGPASNYPRLLFIAMAKSNMYIIQLPPQGQGKG